MDNTQTYSRPAPPRGNPLEPSPVWDRIATVPWDVLPRSPFADAVRFLRLPYHRATDGNLLVETTRDELLLVIAFCQRRPSERLLPAPTANEFVKLVPPTEPAFWWQDREDDGDAD